MSLETSDFETGLPGGDEQDGSKRYHPILLYLAIFIVSLIGIVATITYQFGTKNKLGVETLLFEEDTESSNAPLFIQRLDNTNLLNKFMLKYGLDGSDGAFNYDTAEVTTEKGWAYVSIYPSSTCSGTEYATGGVVTGQCFTFYSDDDDGTSGTSVKFQCSNGEILFNKYDDEKCQTLTESRIITAEGCKELNSTWNVDLDDTFYGDFRCSSGPALPFVKDYDLFRAYINDNPGHDNSETCDGLALFEANPLDTCVPIYWQDKTHSIIFGVASDDDSLPYATFYTESADCSGTNVNLDLHTSCTGITLNDNYFNSSEVSYDWEYYAPTTDKTFHPSLAPTALLEFETKPTLTPTGEPTEETQSPTPAQAQLPTPLPTEESDLLKTGNPTRSWFKTGNPTPGLLHPTSHPVDNTYTSEP